LKDSYKSGLPSKVPNSSIKPAMISENILEACAIKFSFGFTADGAPKAIPDFSNYKATNNGKSGKKLTSDNNIISSGSSDILKNNFS